MQNLSLYVQLLQNLCQQKDIITDNREKFRPDTYPLLLERVLSLQKLLLEESQRVLKEETQPFFIDEACRVFPSPNAVPPAVPAEAAVFPETDAAETVPEPEPRTDSFVLDEDIPEDTEDIPMPSEAAQPEAVPVTTEEPAPAVTEEPEVVTQTGASRWEIPEGRVICQTQDVVVTRNGESAPIRFSVAPLQAVKDGLVPIIVNAEYQDFTINQVTTFMSEEGESLLQMDVDRYTFLIKGSFTNGAFNATIMSTGRSVENGDVVTVTEVRSNQGTAAAPEIRFHDNAILRIAFNDDSFFGMLHSGEWIDEFNATHDAMIEINGDYNELKVTRDSGWVLRY